MDNTIKKNIEAIQNGAVKKGNYNFKDVHVFTMPSGTKKSSSQSSNGEADNAKKVGFIILVVGFLFLTVALAGSYYYFVMKPNKQKVSDSANVLAEKQKVEEPKKEVEKVVKEAEKPKVTEPTTPASSNEVKTNIVKQDIKDGKSENINDNIIPKENAVPKEDVNIENKENNGISESIKAKKPTPPVLVDNDGDGLSAEEEIAVGTSDNSPDTDSDGYNDLAEMLNGYNPLGEGTINDSAFFQSLESAKYGFSLSYPKVFQVIENTGDTIIIDLGNEEFFQIYVEPNVGKLSMEDWYKKQFGVNTVDKNLFFNNGDWEGIKKADQNSMFIKNINNDYVIAFNYSSVDGNRYLNIFKIVSKSFKIVN